MSSMNEDEDYDEWLKSLRDHKDRPAPDEIVEEGLLRALHKLPAQKVVKARIIFLPTWKPKKGKSS